MKTRNIRIGTQLGIGFTIIIFFVIAITVVAYMQTSEIHEQTEMIYQHPFQVRRAIGALDADILTMSVARRDMLLTNSYEQRQKNIQIIVLAAADAEKQFGIFRERYLGPKTDVEEAYQAYLLWYAAGEENTRLILSGEIEKAKQALEPDGAVGSQRSRMLASLGKIDTFARNKGESLYQASVVLKSELQKQLTGLLIIILLISLSVIYIVIRNIRTPLKEISDAVLRFHEGDMDARSPYKLNNEFGILSDSINTLVSLVQENTILSQKTASLAKAMLVEHDARKFFQVMLRDLAAHTESQIAAVYLLSDDEKSFEHFESFGMAENAKAAFRADCFEGEFGAVILTQELQCIHNISEETRFIFNTVNGIYVPREIITIPILSANKLIAIISLATISKFSPRSIDLIHNVIVALSARIEGVLAYERIKEFMNKIEHQNQELTAQKWELAAHSSELKQQNSELEMQKKQLYEASQLKTNFLSNMSHELRTPLNSVIALSGVLSRRLSNQIPEEEYSYLEIIERNGKNLLGMINDILDISRIEAGREEINIAKFNFNNIMSEVYEMIQQQAKEKNINLIYQKGDPELIISSDADKCRHILQNLVGNAVKFTDSGQVVISAQKIGNEIEFKVADTGIGIAPEHLSSIFDEFKQADGSTSRKYGGTGLGLAIAEKYATLLGGTISVESTLGVGSVFTLLLPICCARDSSTINIGMSLDCTAEERLPMSIPDHYSFDKTILLVDDNEAAVIQIKDLVEAMGHKVLIARDGGEALKIIDQVIPDAMLLDLMMPGIDGFTVLEILRNAEPTAQIPVLVLTAKHITKEELRFLKRNNVHQLIQKGAVDREKLQNSVTSILFPGGLPASKPHEKTRENKGKPLVLVVEDNPDNMITVRALLADRYCVVEAVTGNEGIEMAKQHIPDFILMDIALPGIDGAEAFKIIRNTHGLEHIPVIALTASTMEHEKERILSYGFDAFLSKPIISKEFFDVIEGVLYEQ